MKDFQKADSKVNDRVHIIKSRGHWNIKKTGKKRAYKKFDKYEETLAFCVENFRNQGFDIVCHKEDGSIKTIISAL